MPATIDVGRGLGILWRGGEELPDGRFEPLGPDKAMALLEQILVQLGVAKNVKELFEKTPVEEREQVGSPYVLVSRFRPTKPVPTALVMQRWVAQFPRKLTPRGTPAYEYEIRHTGPENIEMRGGGKKIEADGVTREGLLQEAKFIEKPVCSPSVAESAFPDKLRPKAWRDMEYELKRYAP